MPDDQISLSPLKNLNEVSELKKLMYCDVNNAYMLEHLGKVIDEEEMKTAF
jgi:hypothetical protein